MIKINKIKPMFNSLICTMNKYNSDTTSDNGIIDTSKQEGCLMEYQTVLAIGESVRGIKVGDLVCVNPTRFAKPVHKKDDNSILKGTEGYSVQMTYNFDTIEIGGELCLLLQDRDIDFIIEEFEEVPDNPILEVNKELLN